MLEILEVSNFKCFKKLELPVSPLTLLTGFNATGKSSSIQLLLLLAQSIKSNCSTNKLSLNGDLIKLGSPGDVLFELAEGKTITLGVVHAKAKLNFKLNLEHRNPNNSCDIECIDVFDLEKGIKLQVNSVNELLSIDNSNISSLINELTNVIYIGLTRFDSEELYPSPNELDLTYADAGIKGQYAPWLLSEFGDDDICVSRHYKDENASTFRKQLIAWFGFIFPGSEVNAYRVDGTSLVKFQLRNSSVGEWRSSSNIGYGLSYIFPILVTCLLAKKGQIIVIDSPEAHIHPEGQSKIAQFLSMIASTGVQIIVETHSDHVLNGVRLATLGKMIPHEEVAIHFFNKTPTSSQDPAQITSPAIDYQGNISDWPDGFFDQTEKDLATLAGW
jgi:predicted ATPase